MADMPHLYWAFLSYCGHDARWAHWLQKSLETYRVPRRLIGRSGPAGTAPASLRPIFRDRTELPADADLAARIENALARSACLIVVCSPEAARSQWVEREIVRFRELHLEPRILTIIVAGSPTDPLQNCFPPALRHGRDDRSAAGTEPVAADVRRHGDGRRMAVLKLVAGMLGLGLDELVQRDHQRRQRRLALVTGGALAGMAAMGTLALAAWVARNDAQRQRGQAEGLIEFMLTDLRRQLEPTGHLDQMDGVGREALKYYVAQRPRDLDAESLSRRARALRLMGEIRVQRGDLDDALLSFEQASATTREILDRSPTDAKSIFNHAQNVFWVGEVAHQRGDLAAAEASFQDYRRLALELTTIDSRNQDWLAEVAYAESALGVLYLQGGRTRDSTAAFERSLAVDQSLADAAPHDANLQVQLGQGHAWLADALQKLGRLADARLHRETELTIYRAVLQSDPTLRQAKFSVIVATQNLGRLAQFAGDDPAAMDDFERAARDAEAMLVEERDNMDLSAVVAIAHVDHGEMLLRLARPGDARAAQRRAAALLDAALAHDGTVALWRYYRGRARLLEAALAARDGDHADALRLARAVLADADAAGVKSNTEPFWLAQRARLQLGDELAAAGHEREAQAQWTTIADNLRGEPDSYEPKLLLVLADAEQRLGRTDAARAIAKRLLDESRPTGGGS